MQRKKKKKKAQNPKSHKKYNHRVLAKLESEQTDTRINSVWRNQGRFHERKELSNGLGGSSGTRSRDFKGKQPV